MKKTNSNINASVNFQKKQVPYGTILFTQIIGKTCSEQPSDILLMTLWVNSSQAISTTLFSPLPIPATSSVYHVSVSDHLELNFRQNAVFRTRICLDLLLLGSPKSASVTFCSDPHPAPDPCYSSHYRIIPLKKSCDVKIYL